MNIEFKSAQEHFFFFPRSFFPLFFKTLLVRGELFVNNRAQVQTGWSHLPMSAGFKSTWYPLLFFRTLSESHRCEQDGHIYQRVLGLSLLGTLYFFRLFFFYFLIACKGGTIVNNGTHVFWNRFFTQNKSCIHNQHLSGHMPIVSPPIWIGSSSDLIEHKTCSKVGIRPDSDMKTSLLLQLINIHKWTNTVNFTSSWMRVEHQSTLIRTHLYHLFYT